MAHLYQRWQLRANAVLGAEAVLKACDAGQREVPVGEELGEGAPAGDEIGEGVSAGKILGRPSGLSIVGRGGAQ